MWLDDKNRMMLSEVPGSIKKFRKTRWKFQQTFETPLKNLQPFVRTIVSASQPLQAGSVTIDQWVFEPKHLIELLTRYSMPLRYEHDLSLIAHGEKEIEELLGAIFSDWIDFVFVPLPKSFAIYADHDEFTTFYAHTRSSLNRVTKPLASQGFRVIEDYQRPF
ncbi:MAG TPA: hypothetical protein VK699_16245 [Terriglobales bacterium]|jgi:hypothetical protein|nr:hypothetical protein [Terriglobales bacterium]